MNPEDSSIYHNLAVAIEKKGDINEAIRIFKKTI